MGGWDPDTCLANVSLATYQIQRNLSSRFRYTNKGCARAHVQLCPTLMKEDNIVIFDLQKYYIVICACKGLSIERRTGRGYFASIL